MKRSLVAFVALAAAACDRPTGDQTDYAARVTGGDPGRGRELVVRLGCATCHTIPGVSGDANVGPPLARVGSRVYLGGVLLNTPENMARWIKDPPAVDPKTAMPNVGATDDEVRDVSAYLYSLR